MKVIHDVQNRQAGQHGEQDVVESRRRATQAAQHPVEHAIQVCDIDDKHQFAGKQLKLS
jgi:hypothetical protein